MSCIPRFWKKTKSKQTEQDTLSDVDHKEQLQSLEQDREPSSPPPVTPRITFTTSEEEEVEEEGAGRSLERTSAREKRGLRSSRHKMSVTSDGGYSSAPSLPSTSTLPSTTTLDVFRPRTLTGSSNGSSAFHTPQGSIHNDPSPTSTGGAMPQFPDNSAMTAHMVQLLEDMKEKLDKLLEGIGKLESSISERLGGEKGEKQGIQQVESMPDLTELPNTQCDTKVLLWLVSKVTEWKFLARWLGLQENDISHIEKDNPRSGREQCYQMFLKWKSVNPENSTYSVLGEALRRESQELFNAFMKEVHGMDNEQRF